MHIYRILVDFKNKIENPDTLPDKMDIDSTIWYMEALLNVKYGNPDSVHPKVKFDTSYFNIVLDNEDKAPIKSISDVYYKMKDTIFGHLARIGSESKDFWAVDLQPQLNNGELNIMLISSFGINSPLSYAPFTDEDDWIFGHSLGYCTTGAPPYSDGGEELEKRLNNPYFAIGGLGKIIKILYYTKFGYEYPDIIYDTIIPGELSYPCMENEELTERLWLAHDVFYNDTTNGGWLPDYTWTFEWVDVKAGEREIFTPVYGYEYYHYYHYQLAEREVLPPGI
ncbi:MAG: hypothetical protein J7J86_00915 [Bacteroidales bacterium]|nr:hypothetical protein [Bacteroidales bacterium]